VVGHRAAERHDGAFAWRNLAPLRSCKYHQGPRSLVAAMSRWLDGDRHRGNPKIKAASGAVADRWKDSFVEEARGCVGAPALKAAGLGDGR